MDVAYLPPYSPDLNPIEQAFVQLKAWIQRRRVYAGMMQFEDFLAMGLDEIAGNAKGHFWECRIAKPVEGEHKDYFEN